MKKVMMLATVPSMIGQFNMNNIQILQDMGYEVHVGCDFTDRSVWTKERVASFINDLEQLNIKYFQIDFCRSAVKINRHIISYKQLKKVVKKNRYGFIHCHTPIAGVIARLVCKNAKTKCIYTAHGFHFYKGAPVRNWLVFYPIEWMCSWWTDILITINKEDYGRAKKHLHAKSIKYIPGVGVDIEKINSVKINRNEVRKQLKIPTDAFLIISVGELNENKNHEVIIKAIKQIENSNIYYVICGVGDRQEYLLKLIETLHLKDKVKLLGFRKDVIELCKASELFTFPSKREGLSVALMEAIAIKIPVICSDIRGNKDLIQNKKYRFAPQNIKEIESCIKYVVNSDSEQEIIVNYEHLKNFDVTQVSKKMFDIYSLIQDIE